jgi:hypothetical protein
LHGHIIFIFGRWMMLMPGLSSASTNAAMSALLKTEEAAETAPSNAVDAVKKHKEPPPDTRENIFRRRMILLSFWAVALFFGLPVWWKTTTVYRAPLPLNQMLEWADGKVGALLVTWRVSLLMFDYRYANQHFHYK